MSPHFIQYHVTPVLSHTTPSHTFTSSYSFSYLPSLPLTHTSPYPHEAPLAQLRTSMPPHAQHFSLLRLGLLGTAIPRLRYHSARRRGLRRRGRWRWLHGGRGGCLAGIAKRKKEGLVKVIGVM
jgi:hypothetical protein